MPTLVSLVFPERGNLTLKAHVSDEQAIYFATFLFNDEEKNVYQGGQFRLAAEMLLERRKLALQSMDEETLAELILNRFFVDIAKEPLRTEAFSRLCEIFEFPPSMVFDKRKKEGEPHQYKICLDRAEIAQIVLGIIQTLSASASDSSIPTQETNAPPHPEPVAPVVVIKQNETQAQIEKLTQEIERLKSLN